MSASGRLSGAYRFDAIELSIKLVIALLFMASVSPVGGQTLQTLCSFSGTNGAAPEAALTLGNDGNFYGTKYGGGSNAAGTIFQVTTNGLLNSIYSFPSGLYPNGLTLGNDGNFYGTTSQGGIVNSEFPAGMGTVFQVTTNGTLTTLASFSGTNGADPEAALALGNDGNFYGTTYGGGLTNRNYASGIGTVFRVTTSGTLTMLASFSANAPVGASALTLGNDGNFYGTTAYVSSGYGTVFRITTNGTLTTLNSLYDGGDPTSALTLGNDGNFYGTTYMGGSVFDVTTNGMLTTFASFSGTNGAEPNGLTLGGDGNFYGTTIFIGSTIRRTIFQLTTNGTLTTLYSFTNGGGATGVTLGSDGSLYGTIENGGITNSTYTQGMGTVFRLLLTPTITVQPQCQTNYAGATVTFSVGATSRATNLYPNGYQWQRNNTNLVNGGNILGATNSTLTIVGVSDGDAGSYSVFVSNDVGRVSSSNATLTVNDSPFYSLQPSNQTVRAGGMVIFTASVYGDPPFVFQWYFDQTPVGPQTTGTNVTSLTLTDVGTNQAGNYTVELFNGSGSLMSSNAVLTVIPPPTLGLQILAGYPALSLYGTLGNSFVVQFNTNLATTNWINLLSLTNLSTNPYQFLDPAGAGQPARFYRAFFAQ
jgi:uncharacterized repeat protein (TIGR03803 family)